MDAGLRELGEETGLVLPSTTIAKSRVLALWESVYPYSLSRGPPKRHHIVTYYYVRSSEHSSDLQARMQLDATEVEAAMWLNAPLASLVATGKMPDKCPNKVELTLLGGEGGGQVQGSLPSEVPARDFSVLTILMIILLLIIIILMLITIIGSGKGRSGRWCRYRESK